MKSLETLDSRIVRALNNSAVSRLLLADPKGLLAAKLEHFGIDATPVNLAKLRANQKTTGR